MRHNFLTVILSIFIFLPAPAYAQVAAVPTTSSNAPVITNTSSEMGRNSTSQKSIKAANQASKLTTLIQKADTMIQVRVTSLNAVLTRVNSDTKLTSDDKSALIKQLQGTISGLTALKAKIDVDTDLATARADTKQIVDTYHVYMILEPQTRLVVTIDNMLTLDTKLTSLVTKLQTLLASQKGTGKDLPSMQALLDDAKSQLASANTKLATDKTTVLGVILTDASGNQVLKGIRQDLNTNIAPLFVKVRFDLQQFRTVWKGNKATIPSTTTTSLTPSVTVTP